MDNNEMSPKELVSAILHRWKAIIVFAIIFACLLGGYSYYARLQNMAELHDKEQAAYESTLSSLRTSIDNYSKTEMVAEDYNANSLLMVIDPYNKQVASLSFGIDVEADVFNLDVANQMTLGVIDPKDTMVRRILNCYLILAKNAPLIDVFGDIFPKEYNILPKEYEETYLRELITVDGSDGIITINTVGISNIDALRLAELMYSYLVEKQALVTSTSGTHTLKILGQSSINLVDLALAAKQTEQRRVASENKNMITGLLDKFNTAKGNKPSEPTVLPFVIQRSFLGAVGGIFLGVVMAVLLYITQLPIQFSEHIQSQVGIRFLGGVLRSKKNSLFKWISGFKGRYLMAEEPEALKIIAANLEEVLEGHHKVLVTGSLPEKVISSMIQSLSMELKQQNVEFLCGSDINASADTIRKLAEADAVILVERLQVSRLKTVLKEKERIDLTKKPILGYVLY